MPTKGDTLLERDDEDERACSYRKANKPAAETITEAPLQVTDRENYYWADYEFEIEERGEHEGGRYPSAGLRYEYGDYRCTRRMAR